MSLNVALVLRATGATVTRVAPGGEMVSGDLGVADLERVFRGVTIDSRTTGSDDLFVALRGQHFDGHSFAADVIQHGAGAVLVEDVEPLELPAPEWKNLSGNVYIFQVRDALSALQQLARAWRRRQQAHIVGVTGSLGKTTMKEIVASVLSHSRPVLRSEANLNTEIGLPLMLLRLNREHRAAVLEMGMHEPGDIALLADIAEAETGIVTNVEPVHLARMGSIERIAREKSRLIAALPPDGLAVLNGDNRWTRAMAAASGLAPTLTYGLAPDCDVRAVDIVPEGLHGVRFTVEAESQRVQLKTGVAGSHTVLAFLAAIGVARHLGMSWDEIPEAVAAVRFEVRQRIHRLPPDESIVLIDDSYNASPASMSAALELLAAAPGVKIAVLGDMLELGPWEEEAHRTVGTRAAEVADWLVVLGQRSAWIAEAAENGGLSGDRVIRTENNVEATEAVRAIITHFRSHGGANTMHGARGRATREQLSGEVAVLVKGSRGMRMEEVVEGLKGTE